jgi:hypothetical protein
MILFYSQFFGQNFKIGSLTFYTFFLKEKVNIKLKLSHPKYTMDKHVQNSKVI